MFEELLNKAKETAVNLVKEHPDAPSEHAEGIAAGAMESVSEELKSVVSSGNFSSLTAIFSENGVDQNNDHVKNIVGSFANKLVNQFSIDNDKANTLSSSLIPTILTKVKEELGDGKLDLKSLMSKLSFSDMMKIMSSAGSGEGGILGKLKGVFGK